VGLKGLERPSNLPGKLGVPQEGNAECNASPPDPLLDHLLRSWDRLSPEARRVIAALVGA